MDHQPVEVEVDRSRQNNTLDEMFRAIWEKIHAASRIISELREEKRSLTDRLGRVEREVSTLRAELATKEQEFKRLRAEHAQMLSSNGQTSFTPEEREILKGRVRDLIAKINSHL